MKTRIPELRKARKISQEELARSVGVTRQTITSIEVGKYTASLVLAYKIAKYFNLMIEEVFDFEEELNNVLSVNSNNNHYKDFVYGYQTGLSFSLLIFPCINLISNFFLAKNKTKLVNKYINHHDERKLFIYDKIGNNSVFILEITSMALASIIAPLYSFDLLLGIITCIFIIMIIRVYLYFYYNRKY